MNPAQSAGYVTRFAGFRRTVSDLSRSIEFYINALGFAAPNIGRDADTGVGVCLTLGNETIELVISAGFTLHKNDKRIYSNNFQHIAIVTRDMGASIRQLARFHFQPISSAGAVRLPADTGGVSAFKFRDPDGHPLELIFFPPGVGNAKWQATDKAGATLGIDHSAIGVCDVNRSLRFYVGGLGFSVASQHLNHGPEQALLDGVVESTVEVIGLAPGCQGTPHVELLGYRTPAPSTEAPRPALGDGHSDRMLFIVDDLDVIAKRLGNSASMAAPEPDVAFSNDLLVSDPDGHLMVLQQADASDSDRKIGTDYRIRSVITQ